MFATGILCPGIREGRTSTRPLPNCPVEVLVDQLAACALTTGQTPKDIRLLVERELAGTPLWAPQTTMPS